jgi:transcriptional regulator with XRE-family HTH domain
MTTIRKKRSGTDKLPFAKILKRIMDERGLSIGAIAEMAGVSRSVVQSWTAQANPHDLQAVARLAKALNLSFKELLLGESDQKTAESLTVGDMFEEKEFFEGICKVSIQRLVPKKGEGK